MIFQAAQEGSEVKPDRTIEKKEFARRMGERLQSLRKERGETQANLALEIDSNFEFISKVENGRSSMSLFNLSKIARKLNTSADYFLYGKEVIKDKEWILAPSFQEYLKECVEIYLEIQKGEMYGDEEEEISGVEDEQKEKSGNQDGGEQNA